MAIEKIIGGITLDLSDLKEEGGARRFTINGTKGSVFSLEIKNEDSYYYNFTTGLFQAAKARLDKRTLIGSPYSGVINFPAVSDDDQYDIYLWAENGTKHTPYLERRFRDRSVDINRSKGSNSLLLQKVIYQYTNLTLTLTCFSFANSIAFGGSGASNATITLSRGKSTGKVPFEIKGVTTDLTKSYQIKRQPTQKDIWAFLSPTLGSPIQLPGENIYPAVSNTDTVDGDFTAGTSQKIVMDTNVANKMAVGDKITIATADATDTTDGSVGSGDKVVMDNNVVTKMAVGDRITVVGQDSDLGAQLINNGLLTVRALNPDGDNAKEFQASADIVVGDNWTLQFTPKCNRELFTVAALNPDEDNVKEFSYVGSPLTEAFGVRDGSTLSFSNQMNYQWAVNTAVGILEGSVCPVGDSDPIAKGTKVSTYEKVTTLFADTKDEVKIKEFRKKPIERIGTPTVTKGVVTTQAGNIIFNKQQTFNNKNTSRRIGSRGELGVLNTYNYNVKFSDLSIELAEVSTTTTSSTIGSASTSVVVASRNGILDNVSVVSGIGIDDSSASPTVASGAGSVSGAGTIVLSAAQELESGVTLKFSGSGQTFIIKGNINIIKAGTADQTIRFDLDNLVSWT